ncbi:MAG: class I SAM-dependent methyltransferase [Saccharofermentanales bacterium]
MVINELLEILFFRNINELIEMIKKLDNLYFSNDHERYEKEVNSYIYNRIKSKENLLNIIEDYDINGLPIWQNQEAQNCDYIGDENLTSIMNHGTIECGKERYELYEKMRDNWANHLDDYAEYVNSQDNIRILELATGAGLGSCAVMNAMKSNTTMISIDIDFGAARNADGLAKYLKIDDRVCGLNANFWCLPFKADMFDVVCTHYGLDESAELPKILFQIAKVLKTGGKFIGVCRKYPFDRHKRFLQMFNINEDECNPILKKVRLYSGFEDLVELAKNNNLELHRFKEFIPVTSHSRILFEFTKR